MSDMKPSRGDSVSAGPWFGTLPPFLLERIPEAESRTLLMGVINVTPDSFSDGGSFAASDDALAQALKLAEDGADIIDIGGESTRPFAEPVSADEELSRVIPAIEKIRSKCSLPISIDTSKAVVAEAAIGAGADIINDVTALRGDAAMGPLAARLNVPVVLMHMKGSPGDMQVDPYYDDVIREVRDFFKERLQAAGHYGISPEQIILDPGIGFGKRLSDNLELIRHCADISPAGHAVLIGPSRKAFVGALADIPEPSARDVATLGAVVACAASGCRIVRTHNVKFAREALAVADAIFSV